MTVGRDMKVGTVTSRLCYAMAVLSLLLLVARRVVLVADAYQSPSWMTRRQRQPQPQHNHPHHHQQQQQYRYHDRQNFRRASTAFEKEEEGGGGGGGSRTTNPSSTAPQKKRRGRRKQYGAPLFLRMSKGGDGNPSTGGMLRKARNAVTYPFRKARDVVAAIISREDTDDDDNDDDRVTAAQKSIEGDYGVKLVIPKESTTSTDSVPAPSTEDKLAAEEEGGEGEKILVSIDDKVAAAATGSTATATTFSVTVPPPATERRDRKDVPISQEGTGTVAAAVESASEPPDTAAPDAAPVPSVAKRTETRTPSSSSSSDVDRRAVSAPGVDFSGEWDIIVTDEFKKEYDRYLMLLGQPVLVRSVALSIIGLTTEETVQSDGGRELLIRGRNVRGVWERKLVASGREGVGDVDGGERYEIVHVRIETADGEDVDSESWWERDGTVHKSWMRGVKKYGGGDFESERYLEDDGNVLVCESTFHPRDPNREKARVTWRFQKKRG